MGSFRTALSFTGIVAITYTTAAQLAQGCISVVGDAYPRGMVQSADGGYAFAGWWSSGGLGYVDQEIIKLDADGAYQWGAHFDGGLVEYATCLTTSNDGGFAVGGYTASYGAGGYDIMVVKVDGTGAFQWARTAGTSNSEYGFAITAMADGGFAVAGSLNHPLGDNNVYVARLDAQGAFLWGKEFNMGATAQGEAHAIIEAPDGSLMVAGFILDLANGGFLMRLHPDGSLQWCRKTADEAAFYALDNTLDGNVVVAGGHYAGSVGAGGFDMCALKVDTSGAPIWGVLIGEERDEQAWAVAATPEGGAVLAGDWNYNDQDTVLAYMAKVDAAGQLLWTRKFGNGAYGNARAVVNTSDGGLAVGARGAGSPGGVVLIKTDAQGIACPQCGDDDGGTAATGADLVDITLQITELAAGVGGSGTPTVVPIGSSAPMCTVSGIDDVIDPSAMITIAPQPMSTSAVITLSRRSLKLGALQFTLRDVAGRILRRIPVSGGTFTVERGDLPAGLLFYELTHANTRVASGELVVE